MRSVLSAQWSRLRAPSGRRRLVLGLVAAALLATVALVAPLPWASAADTLLSQGKPVTASSVENAGTPASAAVDGNTATRWSSQFTDPQWLQIDLGTTATISQVVLQWETAYATAFQIQTSNDATTWTTIYTTTTGTGGTQTLNVTGTGRYLRMYATTRATAYGYSLWELQVYGSLGGGSTCGTDNAAQGKPATASSVENAGTPASAAVDANTATRWSSQFTDPQWLQVDLGTSQPICQVVLQWETAYATAFQIQTSNDATTWTTIYTTTTGTGGTQTLNVTGTGRYLRMYATTRATPYGYSLWELTVHTGTSPSPTPSTGWTTVWSEDFTGAAGTAPSSANWLIDTGTGYPGGPVNWGTGEVETMTNAPANVSLDGAGHLALTALNSGGAWTSGRVETQRSDFAAPAGGQLKVTATLKQPNLANAIGYWPAFRAYGAGYRGNPSAWPGVGETDVMEDVNGRSQTAATLHCGTAPAGLCNEYDGLTSGLVTCPGCQTGYHSYTEVIDRTTSDEQIRWYLDDQQVWVTRESEVGVAAWQAAVDHGFFLVFDLAIGGSWPNAVCGCTTPAANTSSGGALTIDSVAVYQSTGTAPPALTTPPTPTGGSQVQVTGSQGNWQLRVNGSPYQVKGMTYGPPAAAAGAYLPDLVSMGVNTIRTWGTDASSKPLLDAASAYGVKVINGFWLNQGADYVNDTAYKTNTLNTIVQWVNTYKNHPGVLMWDVGNEVILTTQDHFSGAQVEQQRIAYAQYVDQVAQAVHAADPNHPVTSTDAWVGAWPYYKQFSPHLDLYAINAYGAVCGIKQAWISGGYTVPYILTEGGPAGEWEVPNDANGVPTEPTDPQKRDGYTNSWNCLTSHTGVALGGTYFHYGVENDFGGVWLNVTPGRWKRLSYYAVRQMYGGAPASNTPPVISGMTAGQNVPAGGQFPVSVNVSDPDGDAIHYNVMLTSKYVDGSVGLRYASFTQTGNGSFSVTAPQTLGTWKVYVYAYDGHGNVGVETRSFTVVPPPVNGTDVARGKQTTASSYQVPGGPYPPGNATDGNFTTRWASDWSDPQWLQVDLGQPTAIKHVQLAWESAYGKAYQIQVSPDGNAWTTVYTTTTGDGGVDDFDVTGTGRFVRLYGTQRGTAYGYALFEFGIYA